MKTNKIFKVALATSAMLTGYTNQAFAIGFDGAEVDLAVYCCDGIVESNRKSSVLRAVVGTGTEFPSFENSALSGVRITPSDIDIRSTQIEVDYARSATFVQDTFNGYVFNFKSLKNGSTIKSVSLNSATKVRLGTVEVSFDSNTIRINVSGVKVRSSSRIVVDVSFTQNELQFTPPTPSGNHTPLASNGCIAKYSINGALNIPCIAVPDALGAVTLYNANLGLHSSPPLDTTFKLWDVQQTGGVSMMSNQCLATYNTDGFLNVPCVSVPSPFGNNLLYQVEMKLVSFASFSAPYVFKLTKTNQIN